MKYLFSVAVLILLSVKLSAQTPRRAAQPQLPPPLPLREVSGVVKDSTGQRVIAATVILKSAKDTLKTTTNEDGIFILKDVRLATFNITVESLGFVTFVKKYLNNDINKRIVLSPVILGTNPNELAEVTINGAPSIVYKTDTVEFRASDYKVRENDTLDELLKKMEGMEVTKDGKLSFQGEEVPTAKLNGKEFAGGNVAQAIQSLPANIIEKVQIVDDYGDQAARTGIKSGEPKKSLNVTTKADRSIGTIGRLFAQGGNNDRYNTDLFVQRINANLQMGIIGGLRNTINGVQNSASGISGLAGGSGTTQAGSPTFNYRNQWGQNLQAIGSYNYNFNNTNSLNSSYGQRFSSIGTSDFISKYNSQNNTRGHNARLELDINLDSANYLQLQPSFSHIYSPSESNSLSDNVNNYVSGFEHPVTSTLGNTLNSSNNYGLTALFQHVFKKPKRNFSVQATLSSSDSKLNGDNNSGFHYYGDKTQNIVLRDSLVHLLSNRTNRATTFQTTITYVEPLSKLSLLEFRGEIRSTDNDSRSTQDTVLSGGKVLELSRLNNIYNYSVMDSKLTFDYRYTGAKTNLSIGASALPYSLRGTKIDNTTGFSVRSSLYNFRLIPAFRFAYAFSQTEKFTVNYSGRNTEPGFQQIQPFTDRSNPEYIIVGNPDLKPTFINTIAAQYNNYIANSRFNLSFGVTANTMDNSIASNTLLLRVPLTVSPVTYKNITEVHYVNLDGAESIIGRYSVSKQLDNRKYNLALNGDITYNYTPAMSNGSLYHQTNWRFNERLSAHLTPGENSEFNPFIGYDVIKTSTTLLNANSTLLKTTSLGLDGRMYFLKTWQVNYSASQRFISGISGPNTNPLVLNAGFQKQFLAKKNLVLTIDVYDLLHQNNYVQQTVTSTGVTNTLSNALSRYFMIGLRLNLQKWSGTPQRNGTPMMRRGDGSFIY